MLAFSFLSEAFAGHTVVTADRHRSSPPRRDPEEEEDRFVRTFGPRHDGHVADE